MPLTPGFRPSPQRTETGIKVDNYRTVSSAGTGAFEITSTGESDNQFLDDFIPELKLYFAYEVTFNSIKVVDINAGGVGADPINQLYLKLVTPTVSTATLEKWENVSKQDLITTQLTVPGPDKKSEIEAVQKGKRIAISASLGTSTYTCIFSYNVNPVDYYV